jgi:hypothetical protein
MDLVKQAERIDRLPIRRRASNGKGSPVGGNEWVPGLHGGSTPPGCALELGRLNRQFAGVGHE